MAENYSLRYYSDPVLRKKCARVDIENGELDKLIDAMKMIVKAKDAAGLAGPQVGIAKKIIIYYDLNKFNEEPEIIVNPTIIDEEGEVKEEEGCLSFPELYLEVARPEKVSFSAYFVKEQKYKEVTYEGFMARVISHEVDHINGVLMIDHLSPVKRELIKGKLKEISALNDEKQD